MGSFKGVKKKKINFKNIVKKLQEQGINAQICKQPKMKF